MRQKDRQKLCSNCDGRIPIEAIICPYCAAEAVTQDLHKQQSLNDSLSALYPPPYSATPKFQDVTDRRPSSAAPTFPTEETPPVVEDKSSFWPLFFLSIGINLLMLGLLQLFFSERGFLRLEWDSSYWFVYCGIALPFVLIGFLGASRLK